MFMSMILFYVTVKARFLPSISLTNKRVHLEIARGWLFAKMASDLAKRVRSG